MPRLLAALSIVVLAAAASTPAATIEPRPFRVPARLPDAAEMLSPSRIHLDGWIGPRLAANE